MRLVDADKIRWKSYPNDYGETNDDYVEKCDIDNMPTVDAVPVVHGRWENGNPICPVCGGNKFKDLDADIWCDWKPDYCPNCGAKMDGGDNTER